MTRATYVALSILVGVMVFGSAPAQAAGSGWVSPLVALQHSAPDDEDFDDSSDDSDEVDDFDSSDDGDSDGGGESDESKGDEGQGDESTGDESGADANSNAPEEPGQQELAPLAVSGEVPTPSVENDQVFPESGLSELAPPIQLLSPETGLIIRQAGSTR